MLGLLSKSEGMESRLAMAIRRLEASGDNHLQEVKDLLAQGAVETVFVKGSGKNSLYCTLPMAQKPPSSVIPTSTPLKLTHSSFLHDLDLSLSEYLKKLAALPVYDGIIANFNRSPYTTGLKVGDLVGLATPCTLPTLFSQGKVSMLTSEKCLGDAAWGRVGMVLSVSPYTIPTYTIPSSFTAPATVVTPPSFIITVKELVSNAICEYDMVDLKFADSSVIQGYKQMMYPLYEIIPTSPPSVPQYTPYCHLGHPTKRTEDIRTSDGSAISPGCCDCCKLDDISGLLVWECKRCNYIICRPCRNKSFTLKGIPLTLDLINVSSNPSDKKYLLDETDGNCWLSSSTGPHWIQLTFPAHTDYPEIQLMTKDYDNKSPNLIRISLSNVAPPGTPPVKLKEMRLTMNTKWETLVTPQEMRLAYPNKSPKIVQIQILSNHLSGSNESKVCAIRLLAGIKSVGKVVMVGERVQLAHTFTSSENDGDGWCLGTLAQNKTGIVVAASPPTVNGEEQRNILVYCEDATASKLSVFKGSWLQRAPFCRSFAVGDIVQLNPATCADDDMHVVGRCLGKCKEYKYGYVTAVGTIVQFIQRNVQVVLIDEPPYASSSKKKKLPIRMSLYCASKLMPASAFTVVRSKILKEMITAIESLVARPDALPLLNATALVNHFNIQAWSSVVNVIGVDTVVEKLLVWITMCCTEPLTVPAGKETISYYYDRTDVADTVVSPDKDTAPLAATDVAPVVTPILEFWECQVCHCQNGMTKSSCIACRKPGELWKCLGCGVANKINVINCSKCKISGYDTTVVKKSDAVDTKEDITTVEEKTKRVCVKVSCSAGKCVNVYTAPRAGSKKPPSAILKDGDEIEIFQGQSKDKFSKICDGSGFVERKDAIFTVIQEIISSEFDSIRPISVIKNDVKVSINSKSQEKLFATENIATEHWACNGKNHWIEILVPKDMVATELKMQIKELRSYTPKDLQISMISAPIILQGPINPLIQQMQLFCDSSCLGGHDPDAECTVCKTLYEDHTPTSHYCSGTNTRGSFPLQKPTSADYPADSLIKVKTTKVDSTQSEFSLLNFSDCVTLQPGLIRIEVLSAQSASECRMSGLKLFGTKLQAVPWKCMLCYEVNSVDNTKLLCEQCGVRKPLLTKYPNIPGASSVSTTATAAVMPKKEDISYESLHYLPVKKRPLVYNCLTDAMKRQVIVEELTSKTAGATVQETDSDQEEESNDVNHMISEDITNSNITSIFYGDRSNEDIPTRERRESITYWSNEEPFEAITSFPDLIKFKDKAGNSAVHHLAYLGLSESYKTIVTSTSGFSQKWETNVLGATPEGLLEGIIVEDSRFYVLHKECRKRELVKDVALTPLSFVEAYDTPEELLAVVNDIKQSDFASAITRASKIIAKKDVHSLLCRVYLALASLHDGYGMKSAKLELEDYLHELTSTEPKQQQLDPMYFYVYYMIWKTEKSALKSSRLRAADALAVFKMFPLLSQKWLSSDDNLDAIILKEDEKSNFKYHIDDEDVEIEEELSPDSPEEEWKLAKASKGASSAAMDKLMAMIGLKTVKEQAMTVFKRTLLDPFRVTWVTNSHISMNFLFVGNPGSGKTTVAELLATAMVQLKFRKNATPLITSASKILKLQDPAGEFEVMVKKAAGGTVFIDEVNLFKPAAAGQQSNASNAVLDYLLEVSESLRATTTFILAGYKEDVEKLLTYNESFPSRFPKVFTFHFEDYTEPQLKQILIRMTFEREYDFESKKSCGVSIPSIMAMRIARGRNMKGFGNAREVRNQLDAAIGRQDARLGSIALKSTDVNFRLSYTEMYTLTRIDAIGDRPNLANSPIFHELDSMVGLVAVKKAVKALMEFQLQNYDREMRGEDVEKISLHRVFLGKPGTGKTTVAKLYGRLLKEFGLLSDGDYIAVTASDLMGEHVGAGATNTNQIIARAKGKVLFIDEAYVLDPTRRGGNAYGGSVLDTLVEKIEGAAGSDMAVILAGYEDEMLTLFRNCGNPGFTRRFQLTEALKFDDFSDTELKTILKSMVSQAKLVISSQTADEAVKIIARRRRLPGFGNAGEVEIFFGRAKANKAVRLAHMMVERNELLKKGGAAAGSVPAAPRHEVLILADFITEETSAQKARDEFNDMQNMSHILLLIDRLEATLQQKKAEGKTAAEIVADWHMVFTGPPGAGKTTAARKFGKLFYNLELLPTDRVVEITGKTMLGQYVGETAKLVTAKMEEARGGILFIDEAYGLLPSRSSYGGDALQTLLDNITKMEFKGNLIVILAGYEGDIEQLFHANQGLTSRFDKMRIAFPSWTGQQAKDAAIHAINKDNKTITPDGDASLLTYLTTLQALPVWASARDVYETILPAMYSFRAERLSREMQNKASSMKFDGLATSEYTDDVLEVPPYTTEDVSLACQPLLNTRRRLASTASDGEMLMKALFRQESGRNDDFEDHLPMPPLASLPPAPQKHIMKYKEREIDEDDHYSPDSDTSDTSHLLALLEEACSELGYTIKTLERVLVSGKLPDDIVQLVWEKNGGVYSKITLTTVCSALQKQVSPLLTKVRCILKQMEVHKTAAEVKIQEKLKCMGVCCMGYEWLKVEGGYQCAGGSHYCSNEEIESYCA